MYYILSTNKKIHGVQGHVAMEKITPLRLEHPQQQQHTKIWSSRQMMMLTLLLLIRGLQEYFSQIVL